MLMDAHNHIGADLFFYLNGFYPYAQDLPALVTEGSRHGIDRWVVFPMVANTWFDPAAMRRGQLVAGGPDQVPYAFENERMLREIYEQFPDLGRLTLPFVMFDPMREPSAQGRPPACAASRIPLLRLETAGDNDPVRHRGAAARRTLHPGTGCGSRRAGVDALQRRRERSLVRGGA